MQLTVFNGSPRNKKSNSKILMEYFLEGYAKVKSEPVSIYYLANTALMDEHVAAFKAAHTVIFIFPLYADSMPGLVKEFFERIAPLPDMEGKRVAFIVQSGFPEAIHSIYVERYLKKLSARCNFDYLGTLIKGGVEGIQVMPSSMTGKLFNSFRNLGEFFARENQFDPGIVDSLRKPLRMSKTRLFFFNVGCKIGLANMYWNMNLKKNKAYHIRDARPFVE